MRVHVCASSTLCRAIAYEILWFESCIRNFTYGCVCVCLSLSLSLSVSLSLCLSLSLCMNICILFEMCIEHALLSHSHISGGCTGEYTDDDRDDTKKIALPPMCTCVCIHLCMQQICRCVIPRFTVLVFICLYRISLHTSVGVCLCIPTSGM